MMLDEMRAFVLVAETGSVQAAAHAIPLTQPAVTRQLQRLERTLGAPLLLVPQRRLRREAVHRHWVRVVPVTPSLDLPILFVPAPRLGVLGRAADALADLLGIWLTADGTPGGNRAEAAGQVGGGLSPAVLQRQRIRTTRAAD